MDPQPETDEFPKLCSGHFTHQLEQLQRTLVRRTKLAILCSTLGYEQPRAALPEKVAGWLLGRISLLCEMGEGMVLWLPPQWRGRLLNIGCGNGVLLLNFACRACA